MRQKGDHPQLGVNPFVIYIGAALAAALLQWLLPLPFVPAQAARIIGAVIIAANFLMGLPALRGMVKARTSPNPSRPTTSLLVSGAYRFSRNPMYIGLTLFYAGVMTWFQLLWGILFTPLVILAITLWVIRPEEEYLARKFGTEYQSYRETVRRWI